MAFYSKTGQEIGANAAILPDPLEAASIMLDQTRRELVSLPGIGWFIEN
jgi:hypothetical protein